MTIRDRESRSEGWREPSVSVGGLTMGGREGGMVVSHWPRKCEKKVAVGYEKEGRNV